MPNIETPSEFAQRFDPCARGEFIGVSEAVAAITARDAAIRAESAALLKTCGEALEAFAKFNDAMKFMGGNFPQTGVVYGVNAGFPHGAEITREDFNKAENVFRLLQNTEA